MAIGAFFKSLFGGGSGSASSKNSTAIEYNGFTVLAEPMKEGGQYRTAGRIQKEIDGELKESRFIRADNNASQAQAVEHSLYKGKQIIDEQGDSLFNREVA